MDATPSVVSAAGLVVARGGRTLLDDVDLELVRGEVVALLGPNGVGKSTLLSVLAGLLPPAGGRVARHGRVVAALQSPALARRSVQANLELALSWWGVPRAQRAARATEALALLHAEHLARRRADELSGGEARRVHLARSLSLQADGLLLDEPFAGLDPPTRAGLLADAAAVLRHPSRATLVVVHDRAEAWALADRLVVLLDGGVAAVGSPADVLERPPTAGVARFLGFTGRLDRGDGTTLLVRPAQVTLDSEGELSGKVERRLPEEDGVLCEVVLEAGRLQVRTDLPGPRVGDAVRLRVRGGASFPREAAA